MGKKEIGSRLKGMLTPVEGLWTVADRAVIQAQPQGLDPVSVL